MRVNGFALIAAVGFGMLLPGCAASPRQRPVPTTRIDTGVQSVEAARRELQGRWSLLSLEVVSADGRRMAVDAAGTLEADAFGNLSIEYRVSPEGLKALESTGIQSPNPVISTTGQVVIDPRQRMITYVPPDAAKRAFDADLAARRNNPFALERARYYALGPDGVLTLSTRYDDGKDASVGRWRRN